MQASEVMTREVITVGPQTEVAEIVELMIRNRISGLPVVDGGEKVIGIVSEGDLLHRIENGTEPRERPLLDRVLSPRTDIGGFIKAHGRRAEDLMTRSPITVSEDTPLFRVAQLLEKHHIKRVPVTENERLRGIITRSNLLQGFAAVHKATQPAGSVVDGDIRKMIIRKLRERFDISDNSTNVVVCNGEVDLWGVVESECVSRAASILVEEIEGVSAVRNHLRVLAHMLNPA